MTQPEPSATSEGAPWWVAAFDSTYAQRYSHRNDEEADLALKTLVEREIVSRNDRVLDLCCGAGRHLAQLHARGVATIGLDYSQDLLALARTRDASVRLVRGDMQALPLGAATFDAVIQMFTAFGYFEDDRENENVLREVARVLRDGGRYVLDLFNAEPTIESLVPEFERVLPDGSSVHEKRWYDPNRRRIQKTATTTTTTQDGHTRAFTESVRVFSPDDLDEWLKRAGFTAVTRFGDYAGARFDRSRSPRMITVVSKSFSVPSDLSSHRTSH